MGGHPPVAPTCWHAVAAATPPARALHLDDVDLGNRRLVIE